MLGRKCLVTGASKGLGYAIAYQLAKQGASVTLVARTEEHLKRNIETFPTNENQSHSYIRYDLGSLMVDTIEQKDPQYQELCKAISQSNVLINCAGLTTHELLPKVTPGTIHSLIGLNLIAPILLSQLSYRAMLKQLQRSAKHSEPFHKPSIINISSVLSVTNETLPGTSVYAALKAGLLGFTQSLAAEFKGKVRVNAILPGLIKETDMGAKVDERYNIPLVNLEDVCNVVSRTVQDESINGQCLIVDDKGERTLTLKQLPLSCK